MIPSMRAMEHLRGDPNNNFVVVKDDEIYKNTIK